MVSLNTIGERWGIVFSTQIHEKNLLEERLNCDEAGPNDKPFSCEKAHHDRKQPLHFLEVESKDTNVEDDPSHTFAMMLLQLYFGSNISRSCG